MYRKTPSFPPSSLRRRLLAASILALAAAPGFARADDASGDSGKPIEEITITQQRLLLKDEDITGAQSEIQKTDIQAAGVTTGSLETLLTMTPSVTAYSEGFGQGTETLAIRGERELEISQTINGMPMTGLLSGAGNFNQFGGPLTLVETANADVYPGVAPPDKQGFGTVGGTINYTTKEAADKRYTDFNYGVGSFGTQHVGFEANTGKLFADDPNSLKALVLYDQSWTNGFVDYTHSQTKNFLANIVQPYNDGLDKAELTIIDNGFHGMVQTSPTPTYLIDQNGSTANFAPSEGFQSDANNYFTIIARNEMALSDSLFFDVQAMFQNTQIQQTGYNNPISLGGSSPYPNGIIPNIQNPYFFYGAIGAQPNFSYDPAAKFGSAVAGLSSEIYRQNVQTVAIQPKLSYFLDTSWAHQEFTFGLYAGRTYENSATYAYGSTQMPETCGYNAINCGGFTQRTVVSGFFQDKIDLLDNTLHLQPGMRIETAYTSVHNEQNNTILNPYVLTNYTKEGEPYLGISYNLPEHVTAYASAGIGSLFAPTADYYVGSSGTTGAPSPEKVYSAEAGLRYDTSNLYLSGGWYYQNVKGGFSFFEDYLINEFVAGNTAEQQLRGVEFAAKYKITPEVSISGNGSYNQAKYLANAFTNVTVTEDQFGYEFAGANTSNVPNKLANVNLEYDDGTWYGRLNAQYTGSSYLTGDLVGSNYCGFPVGGPVPAGYSPGPYPLCGATTTIPTKNPSHTLLNALVSYNLNLDTDTLKTVKLSLNVQNILDKRYYNYDYESENASGGLYGVYPQFSSGLIGPPRSFMFDMSARF